MKREAHRSKYHTNKRVKRRIDRILKECASIYTNLGLESTPEEREAAKKLEAELLKGIIKHDPIFYKTVCPSEIVIDKYLLEKYLSDSLSGKLDKPDEVISDILSKL